MAAKIAFYHRESAEPHQLFVVNDRPNKTVDLAIEDGGEPIITECVVTEEAVVGSCTFTAPSAPSKKDEGEPLNDAPLDPKPSKKK